MHRHDRDASWDVEADARSDAEKITAIYIYTVIIQDTPLGPHNLQDTPVFEKLFRIPPKKVKVIQNAPVKSEIIQTTPAQDENFHGKLPGQLSI